MEANTTQDAGEQHLQHHLVTIEVDGVKKQIRRGKYIVSKLKELIGVPADYELDVVIKGEFHPLDDNAETHVVGHEVFVSHVRRGGSS